MEWISIDKDPKKVEHHIVCDPTAETKVFPAYWDGMEFGNYIGIFEWFPYEDITHWMPLPDPPTNQ